MMKNLLKLKQLVEQSYCLSESYLLESAKTQLIKEKDELLASLNEEKGVKVPIVGDFSAGKSSLINAFLDRESLLPVDITPETAVAYELYYSSKEKVELYRDSRLIDDRPLNDIKKLSVQPGDIAKVYVNSSILQELEAKGIILVDMPGIDSGIKEHNDAILHYIDRGTSFVLLVEASQGSLRQSTLAFMSELSKYNLKPAVMLSKIDKKPASELSDIKDYIAFQSKKAIGSETFVGAISSHENNIGDFVTYINTLDGDELVSQKYGNKVLAFINTQIMCLTTQVDMLNTNIKDADEKIKKLEEEKKNVQHHLSQSSADTPEKSTQDILDLVKEELRLHSEEIAAMIVNKQDGDEINALILNYVRPVIINAFKEEGEQYASALNTVVQEVSDSLQNVLELDGNFVDDIVDSFREDIVGALRLVAEFLTKNPNVIIKILGYAIQIFGEMIPDLIKWLFGRDKESEIIEVAGKIMETAVPQILEKFRPLIHENIVEQQRRIRENIQNKVENNISYLQDSVRTTSDAESREQLVNKVHLIKGVIEELKKQKESI